MRNRKKRPWSKNTDVRLNPVVITALEELADFYGPGRSRAARFFLIEMVAEEPWRKKPVDWKRNNKYLEERPKGQPLVRMPLRIWDNLLKAVDAKAKAFNISRSAMVRRALTMAVDERVEQRFPSLRKTLQAYNLPRQEWPWEK